MEGTTDLPPEEETIFLSLNNPVFRTYLFSSALLVLKVLVMPLLIGRYRFGRGVLITPEDVPMAKVVLGKGEVKYDDPDIERIRRAHLNDIENIPIFIAAGLLYVLTDPAPLTASILYYLFLAFRVLHTLVYAVFVVPQPARFLFYSGGYLITLYMVITVLAKIAPA